MDILAHARRRAFSLWLRTGRLPDWAKPRSTEVKYNPWHDTDDGRFTFTGHGRYFGRGGSGGDVARMHDRPPSRGGRRPKPEPEPFGGFAGGGDGFNGGGNTGGDEAFPDREPQRDRSQHPTGPSTRTTPRETPQAAIERYARIALDNPRNWRRIEANGYLYFIDMDGRTRRAAGILTENAAHRRSRSAQARAGVPDRRPSDDGGHYIARRFNGPTEAFNHFAQDANFNRGAYRALEDRWGRAVRAGQRVEVMIEPVYEGFSRRPSAVVVSYWMGRVRKNVTFPNEPREVTRAKR